jgi:GNAT superfamily N-acetyltransferase
MEIKNLKDKDLSALDGLFRQFWGESSDIEKMAEIFERLSRDKDYILLAAKQNSMLAGFCMGIVCQSLYCDCRPFMVIEDFIVDKQHRRTRIETVMMSSVEHYAIARGSSRNKLTKIKSFSQHCEHRKSDLVRRRGLLIASLKDPGAAIDGGNL